jgi:hypothetical protein
MGFNLRNMLSEAVAHVNPFDHAQVQQPAPMPPQQGMPSPLTAAAIQAARQWQQPHPQQLPSTSAPTIGQFAAAMAHTNINDLPQDNLNGTYSNFKQGEIVDPSKNFAPMLPGVINNSRVGLYSPLQHVADSYNHDYLYALPINPAVTPQPIQPLKTMLPGGK